MKRVCRTLGMLVLTVAAAYSANSQEVTPANSPEVTKSQSAEPVAADAQPAVKDYVFPSAKKRFNRYVMSTVGPMRLLRTGAAAGLDQWHDHPEEWGQGMKGYGKRYASSFGQNVIQQTVTYGLDEALKLDSGFEKSRREGFFPRFKDALLQNVTSRTRSGKRVVSVPRFAGVYTGAIIPAETWYPERYGYKDGLRRGTGTLLTGFGINLIREFVFNF